MQNTSYPQAANVGAVRPERTLTPVENALCGLDKEAEHLSQRLDTLETRLEAILAPAYPCEDGQGKDILTPDRCPLESKIINTTNFISASIARLSSIIDRARL